MTPGIGVKSSARHQNPKSLFQPKIWKIIGKEQHSIWFLISTHREGRNACITAGKLPLDVSVVLKAHCSSVIRDTWKHHGNLTRCCLKPMMVTGRCFNLPLSHQYSFLSSWLYRMRMTRKRKLSESS